jgi:chromosome segregation protein
MADLRQGEAELEALRQAHYDASDRLHGAQGQLSEAALEVSRLEERIRYVAEGRTRAEQRLVELAAQRDQWLQHQAQAEVELGRIADQITQASELRDVVAAQAEEQADQLPVGEDALRQAQAMAIEQRTRVAAIQQQIQVLAAESRSLDEQRRQVHARRDRLVTERSQLAAPDLDHLSALQRQFTAAQEAQSATDARLHTLGVQVPQLDDARRLAQDRVNQEGQKQAELSARLGALRALQDKVQTEGKLQPWLLRHGLDTLPGLWTRIHVEPGWEAALEAALRERLGALEVGRLETLRAFAADAPPAKLAFYTLGAGVPAAQGAAPPTAALGLVPLSEVLRLTDVGLKALLSDWLTGVYCASSLDEALAARQRLGQGEIVMTREGHAVGAHAIAFYAPDSEQAGLLARAQEIENLERTLRAQVLIHDQVRAELVRADAACSEASTRLAAARREAAEAQTLTHRLQVDCLRLSQLAEAASSRRTQLGDELAEIDAQLEDVAERGATGEARFEELDQQLGTAQERHAELEDAVMAADRRLSAAREQLRTLEREAQEAQFAARALLARRSELQRSAETAAGQLVQAAQSQAQVEDELTRLSDTSAQSGLQEALDLRLAREAALGAQRSEYDDLSLRLRRADEQRLQHEQSLQPLRERIGKLQLEQQAAQLGGAQYLEQLVAAKVDFEMLAAQVERDAVRLAGLQGEIERINREVAALGAVNLAALDELTASRERKGFLDAQNADLIEAMTTLEDAIHKIDLETRDLLASTFDQVNLHFGRMFPTLFGGGNARLVMTGDEILDAGVQVMAQPPGKKNSTIHLLSGGEKALTAIALVFAIFQLNPAPFCLLDEVDAPLDDANTERYAKLVREMAQGTQFLFISHNKIAMEMAEQLIGVTMQEQGVSRIVTVDMDSAVSLAEPS